MLQEAVAQGAGSQAANGRTARADAMHVLFNELTQRAALGNSASMNLDCVHKHA